MSEKQKIVSFLVIFILSAGFAYASASSTYQVDDENLNFGTNEGYMESLSYSLDLSSISWTERYSKSGSYTLVDANSDLDLTLTPPTPPPTGGGVSNTGSGGGGGPLAYSDIPIISTIPAEESRELISSEEQAAEEPVQISEQQEPIEILKPSPEEVEEMIKEDKNIFIFTEDKPIIYYQLDKKYDEYDFIQVTDYDIEPLTLNIPEEVLESDNNHVAIEGKTGSGYEVVAIWFENDHINKSYAVADENGEFKIKSIDILPDDKYFVLIYALKNEGNVIVQTNYKTLEFEIADGIAYVKMILADVKKSCIRFDLSFIYILILITAIYSLCKRKD